MKKSLCVFLFCIPVWAATYAQFVSSCNKQAPKISFSGKAPWVIDGKINDWTTILGPYTGNNDIPFLPPATSAFNWANDLESFLKFRDTPKPESDMNFLSFMHDDYNVYFYLRRMANGSAPNTFYYFFDVNGDAVMNLGEPVIHASFTNKSITPLTLGLYIPDRDSNYSPQNKGSLLGARDAGGPTVQVVNGHPMRGDVLDLFNSELLLFPPLKLKKNEVFRAKLTEDGYGIELAMPWRYLKNWLTLKDPLDPGDIFFYKVSMQEGQGCYNPDKVVDYAGSCFGGPGISGNVNLGKTVTTTTLVPGSSYRFKLAYTNLTNLATEVGIEHVNLEVTSNPVSTITANDIDVTVYADNNCNGIVDAGETGVNFFGINNSCCRFSFQPPLLILFGPVVTLPPLGKGCFIVDLKLSESAAAAKFKISFSTSVFFAEGREFCEPSCGSKPINQVGFIETEVGSSEVLSEARKNSQLQEAGTYPDVVLYPNPSRGITSLALPQIADVSIIDNLGRSIQTINKARPGIIPLKHLTPGFYIVKVRMSETGKVVTRKLVVQP